MLYNKLLKILGNDWKKNTDDFVVEINNNIDGFINVNTHHNKENNKCLKTLNIFYKIFVISIISWPIIYALYNDIKEKELNLLKNIIFQLLFLSQYLFGIYYFSNDHFYDKLKDNKKVKDIFNKLIIAVLIITLILISIGITLYNMNYSISIYKDFFDYKAINILLIIDMFFSILSFLVNMSAFCVITIYHTKQIKMNTNNLLDNLTDSNKIIKEFTHMRLEYTETIKQTNILFTALNLFGSLSFYKILKSVKDHEYMIMDIIYLGLFLIIDGIYIFSIKNTKSIHKYILY